jgi:hypothetical protein
MNKSTLRFTIASFLLAGSVALFAPAAEAHGRGHGHHGHRHPHHGKYKVHGHEVYVPRTIAFEYRDAWAPYYHGRVWVPRHRHHHVTYRFPVVVDGYVAYRPYTYCGGDLIVAPSAPLPRVAFGLEFGDNPYFSFHYAR